MFGVEDQGFFEAPACPCILFAGVVGIAHADVQLYRIGVESKSLAEYVQSLIVLTFIVQLMCSLIVLLGTQKGVCHGRSQPPSERVALLYNREAVLFKNNSFYLKDYLCKEA